MALFNWSTTAANNANADPTINWAEGQPPSSVNDSARAMMAAIATWFAAPEWLNYGLTPTYVSATQFTVTGNQTANYSVGRRVRALVSAGTVYGTISASAFTSLTTVTVALDAGNLDSGISEVDVGALNPLHQSSPYYGVDAGGNGGQLRAVNVNYGAMLRNDGTNVYLLQTASGSPYGTFNSFRPFSWSLSTGAVNIDATGLGVTFGGGIIATGLTLNEPGGTDGTLVINAASDPNGAAIKLIGNGSTTPAKFLKATGGLFTVTNNADSAILIQVDDSGNLTALGNITAHSDERLKTDWKPVSYDFLEKLSAIKSGTFRRTDLGEIQAGVSAQDLQQVLPEAVGGGAILSVAYGQAALVACVELAKEVMRLRALLEPVK